MIPHDFNTLLDMDFVSEVMHVLNEGQESAYLVGGCIRNFLLDVPVVDIDIATSHLPAEVITLLQSRGIQIIPTGIEHGTVTALGGNGYMLEITTLRKDVETDGRRAVVAFTKDMTDDAQRRDFTINALYVDINGTLHDPTGKGIYDIDKKVLNFIGEADDRIKEDALRILRFYRFGSVYDLNLPLKEREVLSRHLKLLNNLSKERVTSEIIKILSGDNAVDILCIMEEDGVSKIFDAAKINKQKLQKLQHRLINIRNDKYYKIIWIWCFLNGLEYNKNIMHPQFFCLSNIEQKIYWKIGDVLADLSAKHSLKKLAYKHGKDLLLAGSIIESVRSEKAFEIDDLKSWSVPTFPLTGGDLLDLGLEQGPQIGRVLADVEEWWIENDFSPTHQECLEKAKKKLR